MRNSIKKITAVISAAILGALPMAGSFTANAADFADETVIFRYGDINGDGKITSADANLVGQIVAENTNTNFSQSQIRRADVNGDGSVTPNDTNMIITYVSRLGDQSLKKLKKVYGDADNSGKVTMYDAAYVEEYVKYGSHRGAINLMAADINGDGIVNMIDFYILQDYEMMGNPSTLLIRWGDVNSDGYVNISDYMKLRRVVAEDPTVHLSSAESRRADVNYDGKINSDDVMGLSRYCGGGHF